MFSSWLGAGQSCISVSENLCSVRLRLQGLIQLVIQAISRKQLLEDLQIDLRKEGSVSGLRSILGILWTLSIATAGIYLGVKAFEFNSVMFFSLSVVVIGAEQHRISIIQHEAIHRLIFRSHKLNDYIGLFVLGGSLGILPYTSREAHFSHHKSLGTTMDQERIPYLSAPKTGFEFIKLCILKLTAIEGVLRVVNLLRTALNQTDDQVSAGSAARKLDRNNARLFDWVMLIVTQVGLLTIFYLFVGYRFYLLLWLLPLFTITRLLVAIRSISEHWTNDRHLDHEARYLNSVYCNRTERFLFGPYYFNYHAEHHLFPNIPTWKLPKMSQKLRSHPEFQRAVTEHKSYLFFVCDYRNKGYWKRSPGA